MERIVIIANSFQPLTIITKRSILDIAAALDPSLYSVSDRYSEEFSEDLATFTKEIL